MRQLAFDGIIGYDTSLGHVCLLLEAIGLVFYTADFNSKHSAKTKGQMLLLCWMQIVERKAVGRNKNNECDTGIYH